MGESEEMTEIFSATGQKGGEEGSGCTHEGERRRKSEKSPSCELGQKLGINKKRKKLKDAASTLNVISDDEDAIQDYFKEY